MASLAQCSVLWSILCFYILTHIFFFFFSTFSNIFSSFFFHYIISLQLPCCLSPLSLSLCPLVICILVTVVTWLWWLDPGLVAVRGERFWLGIDRPWTYCVRPCRLRGSTHADNTALHTLAQTHLLWKSLQTLQVVTGGVVFNLIGFYNSSTSRRQSELTALWELPRLRTTLLFHPIYSLPFSVCTPVLYFFHIPSFFCLSLLCSILLSVNLHLSRCLFFPSPLPPSTRLPSFSLQHKPNSHFIVLRSLWIHTNIKQTTLKSAWLKHAQSSAMVINTVHTFTQSQQHWQNDTLTTKSPSESVCCGLFSLRYYFKVQAKNVFGLGPFSDTLTYVTESGVYPVIAYKDKL